MYGKLILLYAIYYGNICPDTRLLCCISILNIFLCLGKRGRLLSLPERQQTQLQSFLQKDEFGYLKWLHDIECKDFKSVSFQKILLSFSYSNAVDKAFGMNP